MSLSMSILSLSTISRFFHLHCLSVSGLTLQTLCRELEYGIHVYDEEGKELGKSKVAAQKAITQVVVSRVSMATPGMGQCTNIGPDLLTMM